MAQAAEERASASALDATRSLERATATLEEASSKAAHARSMAEDASAKLRTAHETESKAARLARYTVRAGAMTVALSWIALVWVGFHTPQNGHRLAGYGDSALIENRRSQVDHVCRDPQQEDHLGGITRLRKTFQVPSDCSCQTVRYRSEMLFPFGKWALASPHS